jgi:hypothetical protein
LSRTQSAAAAGVLGYIRLVKLEQQLSSDRKCLPAIKSSSSSIASISPRIAKKYFSNQRGMWLAKYFSIRNIGISHVMMTISHFACRKKIIRLSNVSHLALFRQKKVIEKVCIH